MNSGSVSIGYQLSSPIEALNGISKPPSPHSSSAKPVATKPIAPNTRCPVRSSSIIEANIRSAMSS